MPSDELFPPTSQSLISWEGLERRINRLLESLVQLRNSNGQLMKENMVLKNQLREKPNGTSADAEKLRQQYEEALSDMKTLQKNILKMEKLVEELRSGEKSPNSGETL